MSADCFDRTRRYRCVHVLFVALVMMWGCTGEREEESTRERHETLSPGLQGFSSNGARIYHTGTNVEGEPIRVEGELVTPAGHSLQTCADCHGPDGGGTRLAFGSEPQVSPGISFGVLSSPDPPRRSHSYSEATLELTLRSGVNPDGRVLHRIMPRLKISKTDMRDLIDYLKTPGPDAGTAAPGTGRIR